jgi:flagellar biosynthesis protein
MIQPLFYSPDLEFAGSVPVPKNDGKAGDDRFKPLNSKEIPKRQVAVAVEASDDGSNLPHITAAGRGKLAEQILQLAFENGIKVREDSALANMLAAVELDSPIPAEAFLAVAEILSYVYRANGMPNPFDAVLQDAMDKSSPSPQRGEGRGEGDKK